MPSFSRVPPREPALQSVRTLARDWRGGGRKTLTADVLSAQGVAAALALSVILTVAWDFRRRGGSRNIDLLLMFTSGVLFFDVMRFFGVMHSPTYLNLLDWVFIAVVAVNLAVMARVIVEDQTTRLRAMGAKPFGRIFWRRWRSLSSSSTSASPWRVRRTMPAGS